MILFLEQVHLSVVQFCLMHEHRQNPCPHPTEFPFANSRSKRCISGTSGVVTDLAFVTSNAFRSNWRSRTPCFVPNVSLPSSTTCNDDYQVRWLCTVSIEFWNFKQWTFRIGWLSSPLQIIFCACSCKFFNNAGCDERKTLSNCMNE